MNVEEVAVAKVTSEMGMDPMLIKSWKEILSDIGKRALLFVSKLFSIKVAMVALVTHLFIRPDVTLPAWVLLAVIGFAIFGREFLKFMKEIKG